MKPLLLAALLPLTASCADLGAYRIVSDGFRFDFGGDTADRRDGGELPATFARLEVDHRFGEVGVVAAGPGVAPAWTWSARAWADSPELARDLVDTIELHVTEAAGVVVLEHGDVRVVRVGRGDV